MIYYVAICPLHIYSFNLYFLNNNYIIRTFCCEYLNIKMKSILFLLNLKERAVT